MDFRRPGDPGYTGSRVPPEGQDTYALVFSESPPSDLPAVLGDAIHNLRATLDLMICDIARVKQESTKSLMFPFEESADKLRKKLAESRFQRLGEDVCSDILLLSPFIGGNLDLRGLHDLDIADKHRLVLPTYVVLNVGLNNSFFPSLIGARGLAHEGARAFGSRRVPPAFFLPKLEGKPYPVFSEDQPFYKEQILATLERLQQMVQDIVNTFAAKYAGKNRGA